MAKFIVRRLLWMLLVLLVVSAITFVLLRSVPGGPFQTERGVPAPVQRALEEKFNLNAPLLDQYLKYLTDILIPIITGSEYRRTLTTDYLINVPLPFLGDAATLRWMNFGPSLRVRSRTVNMILTENLPVSVQLGAAALAVAVIIGVPLGIVAALRRNTWVDYSSMGVAIIGVSVPIIVMAPLLQYIFGAVWKVLPPSGWGRPEHIILPAFTLGFAQSALMARLTRASLLQVLNEDYIRTARAKGLSERVVVMLHALKNSLIPVVTVIGPLFAVLVTGTFVTETIFAVPGMGRYFVTSVSNRDFTVVMGTILLYAVFLVLANLIVDIVYAWLDPRIRYT
jgi:ABC-type dipeptide/oligopeptide/nickel transport system permease component